jgi:hypothetical protein
MSSAWEKFQAATLSLVRSGSIKDRLTDAYRNHLANVAPEELPRDLRDEFRALSSALTRECPLRGEDPVRATVRKMSNDEADHLACALVRLFCAMPRAAAATPSVAPRGVTSAQVVPLFLEA